MSLGRVPLGGSMGHTIVLILNKRGMPSTALPSGYFGPPFKVLRRAAGSSAPRPAGESPGRRGISRGVGAAVGCSAQADGISSGAGSHRHWPLLSLSMPASTFSWCANSSGSSHSINGAAGAK